MNALVVVLAGAGAAVFARRRYDAGRERRRRRRAAHVLPGVVSDLARSVASGATLEAALDDVAPNVDGVLGAEMRGAVELLARGHGTGRVLVLWERATVVDGVDLLVGACRFSVGHGPALVGALDGVASALLDRVEVADEVAALASQARTSTAVLIALPPVGGALFGLLDPGYLQVLTTTTVGRGCLVVGTALDLLGARLSTTLVSRAVGRGEPRP